MSGQRGSGMLHFDALSLLFWQQLSLLSPLKPHARSAELRVLHAVLLFSPNMVEFAEDVATQM